MWSYTEMVLAWTYIQTLYSFALPVAVQEIALASVW